MKTVPTFRAWPSALLWLLAAASLAIQVLLPNFTGIANNGDFGKVYGWLCLASRPPESNFIYFNPDYFWSARNYWDSPYHTSESLLAWLATRMAGATHEGAVFDIRWLGAIHVALCLAALAILLRHVRARYAILPVLIFTDICYTAYFNSFYMDAIALCTLLLMVSTALALQSKSQLHPAPHPPLPDPNPARLRESDPTPMRAATVRERLPISFSRRIWTQLRARPARISAALVMFTIAALLFATSKSQHAVWAILPAAFLIPRRLILAVAVLIAGAAILTTTDEAYRGQALFNVIFYRLGPAGADLTKLGVHPDELRYSGMHSYMPGSPAADFSWTAGFGKRTGFARLLTWYAKHPAATLGFLNQTLTEGAPEMRPSNLSNFQAAAGHPPGARTNRFAWWSNLRVYLSRHWPWHLPLWYAAFFIGCLLSRSRARWLALGIAILGAGEFTAAALGDSLDPGRHLFLFQAATDLTICFAFAALLQGALLQKTMRHKP